MSIWAYANYKRISIIDTPGILQGAAGNGFTVCNILNVTEVTKESNEE